MTHSLERSGISTMTKIDVAFLQLISIASHFLQLHLKMLNITHVSLSVFSAFLIKVEVKLSLFGVVCFKYHTRLVINISSIFEALFSNGNIKGYLKAQGIYDREKTTVMT